LNLQKNIVNSAKKKVEFDLERKSKIQIRKRKSKYKEELLIGKGCTIQRIEKFQNEKQNIDSLINFTHEHNYKPVRDTLLLVKVGKFDQIEKCKHLPT
jgi:hypothetical protein